MFWFGWGVGIGVWTSVLLFLAMVWSMIWKGIALWRAGRNNQVVWFVVLFLINTLGILDIIYLAWFQKSKKKKRRR